MLKKCLKKCVYTAVNITTYMFKVIHYCFQIYLKNLEVNVLKYMDLMLYIVSAPGLEWQACLKKKEVKLELLTDYDMILMIKKGIRGGIRYGMLKT